MRVTSLMGALWGAHRRIGGTMAEQKKDAKPANKAPAQNGGAQASEGPKGCKFDGCKTKVEKFGFCKEHYTLFMEGVIKADGKKPLDYEEKLARFKRNQSKVA
jgi:hypothetical protein